MAEHTPTPWVYDPSAPANVYSDDATGSIIATCDGFRYAPRGAEVKAANAAFIVRACNSHDALVKALEDVREELKGLLAMCEGEVPSLLADHHQWVSAIDAVDHADRVLAALATAEPTGVAASHIRALESDAHLPGNAGGAVMTFRFHCPKCGDDTEQLHEGYCLECCEVGQSELNTHNSQFDAWERMTDVQRDRAIKDAIR